MTGNSQSDGYNCQRNTCVDSFFGDLYGNLRQGWYFCSCLDSFIYELFCGEDFTNQALEKMKVFKSAIWI